MKTSLPINSISESKEIKKGEPKLIKIPGISEYNNVHCSLQDKAGDLWFGTTGEGVYRYDGKLFTQYTIKDGLSSNTVWSMLEDKTGNIWFGTNNGICRYDGKTIVKMPIPLIDSSNSDANTPANNTWSETTNVWSIMQDKKGKLWFATTHGVYCYNDALFTRCLENNSIVNNSGLQINSVEYVLEDRAGNLWLGGRGNAGVFRFDGKSITRFYPDYGFWAWPVLEDKNGNIWFSNWSGVFRYDTDPKDGAGRLTNFTKAAGLCSNGITRIIEDKNGNIWFGSDSENGGLCRYDGKSFTHFTTKDGLINNSIWTILEDKAGNLWIGTRNTGLCRFDGNSFKCFSE